MLPFALPQDVRMAGHSPATAELHLLVGKMPGTLNDSVDFR